MVFHEERSRMIERDAFLEISEMVRSLVRFLFRTVEQTLRKYGERFDPFLASSGSIYVFFENWNGSKSTSVMLEE